LAPHPVDRGVDFVGQVIKPWSRYTRKRTVNEAINQLKNSNHKTPFESANSYLGLVGQASSGHKDKAKLANVMRKNGYCVNSTLSKVYRKST
jgi:lipopolysaccharide export LptBFGC system permease protein LptF